VEFCFLPLHWSVEQKSVNSSLVLRPLSPSPECHLALKPIRPLMLRPAKQDRERVAASHHTPPMDSPTVSISAQTHDCRKLEGNLHEVAVRECISISHPAPSLVSSLFPSKFTTKTCNGGGLRVRCGGVELRCIFIVLYSHSYGWAMTEATQLKWKPFPQNDSFKRELMKKRV
jgi:hypothetical protein